VKNSAQVFRIPVLRRLGPGITIGVTQNPWPSRGARLVTVLLVEEGATSNGLRKAIPDLLRLHEALRASPHYSYDPKSLEWFALLHRLGQENHERIAQHINGLLERALSPDSEEGRALARNLVKSWWARTRHRDVEQALKMAKNAITAGRPVCTISPRDVREALHRFRLGPKLKRFVDWLRQQEHLAKLADALDGRLPANPAPRLVLPHGIPSAEKVGRPTIT